ncbi:MAG TPA: hypothetical protein VJ841_04805 [Candidatus Saccharimonadales bacterium]|nr:hypothetical protein [Candidatus Saccharimonadales bacterium]
MASYIELFGADGQPISASKAQLVKVAKTIAFNRESDLNLLREITGDRSAHYWLIADWPKLPAMLAEIHLFNHYPRPSSKWSATYGIDGIAHTAAFNDASLEHAIRSFREENTWCVDPADRVGMPESVAVIAREKVKYRPF